MLGPFHLDTTTGTCSSGLALAFRTRDVIEPTCAYARWALTLAFCQSVWVCETYVVCYTFWVQDYVVHYRPTLCTAALRCAPGCTIYRDLCP